MRKAVFLLVVSCVLTTGITLHAQDQFGRPGTVPSGKNSHATAAVQASLLAMGGEQTVASAGACVADGQVTNYFPVANSGTFHWVNSGDDYRYETTIDSVKTVEVSNNGHPVATSSDGTSMIYPPNHAYVAADVPHLVSLRLLRHYQNTDASFTLAETSKLPKKFANTFIVRMGYPGNSDSVKRLVERDWVIDSSSGMPTMVRIVAPGYPVASVTRTTDYYLSSYKTVNGLLIPMSITVLEYGVKSRTYTITSVTCGADVSTGQFTYAGGAQ